MKIILIFIVILSSAYSELKIYTNEEPPQQFTQNGKLTGIGTDIVLEIQKRLGTKENIVVYPWTRAVAITKRNPNTILYLAGKTKDRLPYYHFIGPILEKKYTLYGRLDSKIQINNIQEAKVAGKISCVLDDVREVFLRENGFKDLTYVEDHSRALSMLLNKKSDLWASSDWENQIQMRKQNKHENLIKPIYVLYQNRNYIAFNNQTNPKIIKQWEQTLKEIKEDGTMDKIAVKWSKILQLNLKYIKKYDAIGIVE